MTLLSRLEEAKVLRERKEVHQVRCLVCGAEPYSVKWTAQCERLMTKVNSRKGN